MPKRTCTSCGISKPADLHHFYAHKGFSCGLDSACRPCRNKQRNAWRQRNRDVVLLRRRKAYAESNGQRHRELEQERAARFPYRVTAENLMSGVQTRSKQFGLERADEFRRKSYFEGWLKRQPNCECCGVKFFIGPKCGQAHDSSPSIDRFDPTKGYTLQNSRLICWRCNNIKRNYTQADLRSVADWMDGVENDQSNHFEAVAA